ncbi:hypothetical protein DSM112329_03864 [Paraconexibacter sp. AEG42_29]|uniref:Beta-lactamase-related domain-containing protein n=1 Tax=Paraconexibacter sp. AEG42_29 TaxID=2997339 RepID=A0AAU7AZ06_9ACTN
MMGMRVVVRCSRLALRSLLVLLATAGVLAMSSGVAGAAGTEDPGSAPWKQVPRDRLIAECGLDPAMLNAYAPNLLLSPFVVIRHGKLCWEGSLQPNATTESYPVFSATKTFGAMLFGMVVTRSSLLSDTSKVADWVSAADRKTINPDALMVHVLGMVSTNADLSFGKKRKWSYDTDGTREIDVLALAMDKAIAAEPDRFGGAKDAAEFAQKALFDPLGMSASHWPGGAIGGNLTTSVHDMARLGQLILQRGLWQGERVISEEYLYRMTHPSFEDTNTGYGYLTYVNAASGWAWPTSSADQNCSPFGEWPSYPHRPLFQSTGPNGGVPDNRAQKLDIAHVFSSGTGGQKWIVYRGLDIVIATRNGLLSVGDGGKLIEGFSSHKTVWNAIRPAMLPFDPVYAGDEAGFCKAYRASEYAPDLREPWFDGKAAPAASPTKVKPACKSRRRLTLAIARPKGMTVQRVDVRLDGRRVRVKTSRGRMTAVIDLRGRGATVAIVRIVLRGVRAGKPVVVSRTRAFRTCAKGS